MIIEVIVMPEPPAWIVLSGDCVDAAIGAAGISWVKWTFIVLWVLSVNVAGFGLWEIARRVVGYLHKKQMQRKVKNYEKQWRG